MTGTSARTNGLTLASNGAPTAGDVVIGALLEEHRALRTVLAILERLLTDAAERGTAPDFALIASALYYIDDFPERVHHPKEDAHLFAALRRRTNRFNSVLDRLQAEHIRSAQMLARVQRELVHYQGGAPNGLRKTRAAVSAFAAMQQDHMRTEEGVLLASRDCLTHDDWTAIARAYAANDNPLSPDSARLEFRRLRSRILTLLPRKMRLDPEAIRFERETAPKPASLEPS
jgi:hemerythrin-like domain-containing protein